MQRSASTLVLICLSMAACSTTRAPVEIQPERLVMVRPSRALLLPCPQAETRPSETNKDMAMNSLARQEALDICRAKFQALVDWIDKVLVDEATTQGGAKSQKPSSQN